MRQCCPLNSRIWPPTRFVRTSLVEHAPILGPRRRSGKPRSTLQICRPASLPNTGDHERGGGDISVQGCYHSRPNDFWLTNKERDSVGDLGDHADQWR